ncbi:MULTISPECIES: hypothetical protein [Actinoplanes]|jgi:hypothetical protein|uniref:Uncharacterized protein n=1 Tax=Actinoplanes friuliensis DSM 7358 TaxID=1246995 RepID=U5W1T4_9ACTN|nr:hypothetical protein [Actinoplanes friuliensis]AGZ41950.1 hypothetical protein AFR_18360 [Actinoplanes friuliensis DSM 7358]
MESIEALERSLADMFAEPQGLKVEDLGLTDDVEVLSGDVREIRTDLSILAMNRPKTSELGQ